MADYDDPSDYFGPGCEYKDLPRKFSVGQRVRFRILLTWRSGVVVGPTKNMARYDADGNVVGWTSCYIINDDEAGRHVRVLESDMEPLDDGEWGKENL